MSASHHVWPPVHVCPRSRAIADQGRVGEVVQCDVCDRYEKRRLQAIRDRRAAREQVVGEDVPLTRYRIVCADDGDVVEHNYPQPLSLAELTAARLDMCGCGPHRVEEVDGP